VRLTDHTDYALRVLLYLGAHRERLATTGEVATSQGIPRHHLTKIVHQLGRAGFVDAVRGRSGGIRLARQPGDITLGDVVRRTEPDFATAACLDGRGGCALAAACTLRAPLCRATADFLTALDRVTLASLLDGAPAR
jgi:Rrf2 family nitric oxide-sensitive transcriptional repressor